MAKKKRSPVSTKRGGSVDPLTPDKPLENPLEQATRQIDLERAQIGHEIHDALLPLIFAASARVSSLTANASPKRSAECEQAAQECVQSEECEQCLDTRDKLRQVVAWLDQAMQTGRRILTQVYPPELVDQVWSKVAQDTIERLYGDETPSIQWRIDPEADETSASISTAAYRIVVEAVRNAIRHGQATEISVVAHKVGDGLRIVIRDNGCGFEPSRIPKDRFGIQSMIGRAELVGGNVEIDSTAGGPTTVTFTT